MSDERALSVPLLLMPLFFLSIIMKEKSASEQKKDEQEGFFVAPCVLNGSEMSL